MSEQNQIVPISADKAASIMEEVIIKGDLKNLTPQQRSEYYNTLCRSVGMNPLTQPFEYIYLNNKLVLYARRNATDQLRRLYGVNVVKVERSIMDDLYVVTVYIRDKTGREDSDIGAVPFSNLRGDAKANAMMKAITKAKRRATLSLVGLGWLDESEVDTIPDAKPASVNIETGEFEDDRPVDLDTGEIQEWPSGDPESPERDDVIDEGEYTDVTPSVQPDPQSASDTDDLDFEDGLEYLVDPNNESSSDDWATLARMAESDIDKWVKLYTHVPDQESLKAINSVLGSLSKEHKSPRPAIAFLKARNEADQRLKQSA